MLRKSDEDIVKGLYSPVESDNDQILKYLYARMKKQISRMVEKNTGQSHDAEDILQDGLIVLYRMVKRKQVDTSYNVEGYLHNICRNLWLKRLNKQRPVEALSDDHHTIPEVDLSLHHFIHSEKRELLDQVLQQTGSDCLQILRLFYYERKPFKEIVPLMGFSSEQVAKNKKSKCLKKVKDLVLNSQYLINKLKNQH